MNSESMIKLYCNNCGCETWHLQRWYSNKVEYEDEELELKDVSEFAVYECHNCRNFCFVHFYSFFDGTELIEKCIDRYPKSMQEIKKVRNKSSLPDYVCKIYNETIIAILNDCYILAMIGFRGIIEAIALEQNVKNNKHKSLKEYIDELLNKKVIGEKEKKLLDSIRLKGNNAAHEIYNPGKDVTIKALRVINNIIEKLYCLEILN